MRKTIVSVKKKRKIKLLNSNRAENKKKKEGKALERSKHSF